MLFLSPGRIPGARGWITINVRYFSAEPQSIDIGDYYVDVFRIRQELGWTQHHSLRDTIARTLAFLSRSSRALDLN